MLSRAQRRRLWFGLLTILGLARRGFFIPYRYAARLPGPGSRAGYGAAAALFARSEEKFAAALSGLAAVAPELAAIGAAPPPAPRWRQDWFPRLDAAMAYALVRRYRPGRILEVGSGHSTRFLARAVLDGGFSCAITAIDPAPRADLSRLEVELLRDALPPKDQAAGLEPFAALAPGDFLLVDSSHILMPGSDVDFLFGHVLPALAPGVVVQIHDVFLPDDYPSDWDWRGYNEQLGVLQLLLGGGWEVLFASHYATTRMADLVAASPAGALPLGRQARESSLWLRKQGGSL